MHVPQCQRRRDPWIVQPIPPMAATGLGRLRQGHRLHCREPNAAADASRWAAYRPVCTTSGPATRHFAPSARQCAWTALGCNMLHVMQARAGLHASFLFWSRPALVRRGGPSPPSCSPYKALHLPRHSRRCRDSGFGQEPQRYGRHSKAP